MKYNNLFKIFALILLLGQINYNFNSKNELPTKILKKSILNNVIWARLFIISTLADLPDKDAIKNRLIKNQKNFENIITSLYGKNASNKLVDLLQEHKAITADLIQAIKINNKKQTAVEDAWYTNIKDLAIFLNTLNSKLPVNDLYKMLSILLNLTKQEITFRVNKQWDKDIKNFDKILEHAAKMAETISQYL